MLQTKIAFWNVGDSLWLFTIPSFLMFCFQQSAVLSGKTRPVSWGPSGNRPTLKKQNPVDVGFKEKHKNYEQLQRQATTVRRSVWYCNSRHVWNHKAFLITSHSVSSENAANKCHELSLAVPFKSKLPVIDPPIAGGFSAKISVVPYSSMYTESIRSGYGKVIVRFSRNTRIFLKLPWATVKKK